MHPPSRTGPASKKNSTFYVNYDNIREFSKCSHNLLENSYFLEKIMKRIYNILYITFYIPFFPTLSVIFTNVLIIRSWERDFMTFEFLWPTTISPRNASLGSSRRSEMVKAYSPIIFHYRSCLNCWLTPGVLKGLFRRKQFLAAFSVSTNVVT